MGTDWRVPLVGTMSLTSTTWSATCSAPSAAQVGLEGRYDPAGAVPAVVVLPPDLTTSEVGRRGTCSRRSVSLRGAANTEPKGTHRASTPTSVLPRLPPGRCPQGPPAAHSVGFSGALKALPPAPARGSQRPDSGTRAHEHAFALTTDQQSIGLEKLAPDGQWYQYEGWQSSSATTTAQRHDKSEIGRSSWPGRATARHGIQDWIGDRDERGLRSASGPRRPPAVRVARQDLRRSARRCPGVLPGQRRAWWCGRLRRP